MTWRVEGMFCPHCEQTILGALSGLPGLSNVRVSYRASTLSADWDRALLSEKQLADILANHGYTLKAPRSPLRDALGFAGGVAALILLFFAVDRSPLGTWIAAFPTAKAGMSLGALFLVGLMTSLHCVAMCGGINVASAGNTRRSAILYNLGRVVSYTLVGAIVGALGQRVQPVHRRASRHSAFCRRLYAGHGAQSAGLLPFSAIAPPARQAVRPVSQPFILRHRSG